MPQDETSAGPATANPGYAGWQIARALTTSDTHPDAATRERAGEKVAKWVRVLDGMASGALAVGSRQPIRDTPVWATPEVVTGGFVTGGLLAGGPLRPHEESLLQRLGGPAEGTKRDALNLWFLSEEGLAELSAQLVAECYEVSVPEEGALLVVAWLAGHGHAEKARQLLDLLSPHFNSLRFYPAPAPRVRKNGAQVILQDVGTTLDNIRRLRPNPRIVAQREAIDNWTPLYDRMIALFLETVEGELPRIEPDAEGRWVKPGTRKFAVAGGWPCRQFPSDWKMRARQALADGELARGAHSGGRAARKGDSFARLQVYLRSCLAKPESLSGRDVGMIRLILARHLSKRGAPGSDQHRELRARQARQVSTPEHHVLARVVQARLASHEPKSGLEELEPVLQPVTAEEGASFAVVSGAAIPPSIVRKVSRSLSETPDALVARGVITSGDVLASVIPQITSNLRATGFADPALRHLYGAIYRAFRRRRSLLLLNLESQVRLEELPWVAALERFRERDLSAVELAQRTLKEVAALTLRAFPCAIIPNKLLQELQALAKGANLQLPLVEELAADIFMDQFSPKFTEAARQAAELLRGSLYARYFAIDGDALPRLPQSEPKPTPSWFRTDSKPADPLVALCIARAGAGAEQAYSVARNGMVIEQEQILTTHNLAALFRALDLQAALREDLRQMAVRCFEWICRRQQVRTAHRHAALIMVKNTAYAWRQMIFFLAQMPSDEVAAFLGWAEEHLNQQTEAFRRRFLPALRGLAVAHAGRSLDDAPALGEGARRFLGWSTTRHWILGEDRENSAESARK